MKSVLSSGGGFSVKSINFAPKRFLISAAELPPLLRAMNNSLYRILWFSSTCRCWRHRWIYLKLKSQYLFSLVSTFTPSKDIPHPVSNISLISFLIPLFHFSRRRMTTSQVAVPVDNRKLMSTPLAAEYDRPISINVLNRSMNPDLWYAKLRGMLSWTTAAASITRSIQSKKNLNKDVAVIEVSLLIHF